MTPTAYITSARGRLLPSVVVVVNGRPGPSRPLPYGAVIPDGADTVLRDLGYRRAAAWTSLGGEHCCPVVPYPSALPRSRSIERDAEEVRAP